jgi:predicted nuclease of predicted toxin-antitoxin system
VRFLVDAQLPPGLADWLGSRGMSASSVSREGLRDSDDGSIAHFAMAGDWVLITKDEELMERGLADPPGLRVVWLRIGNSTNQILKDWLEPLLPEITRRLEEGQRVVEVRR